MHHFFDILAESAGRIGIKVSELHATSEVLMPSREGGWTETSTRCMIVQYSRKCPSLSLCHDTI